MPVDAPIEKDGMARLAINLRGDIAGLPSTVAGGYEIGSVDLAAGKDLAVTELRASSPARRRASGLKSLPI